MQRNTKRIVGKGVVCLLCFLLGGVATPGDHLALAGPGRADPAPGPSAH
ncbi:MAG: hypothetical protein ACLRWL_05640 [Evtepia gabavorous]